MVIEKARRVSKKVAVTMAVSCACDMKFTVTKWIKLLSQVASLANKSKRKEFSGRQRELEFISMMMPPHIWHWFKSALHSWSHVDTFFKLFPQTKGAL